MTAFTDQDYKVSDSYGIWDRAEDCDMGIIRLPEGFVRAYAQGDDRYKSVTYLDFIHNGRQYTRRWADRRYSRRYMVTLAKRFVCDIVQRPVAARRYSK